MIGTYFVNNLQLNNKTPRKQQICNIKKRSNNKHNVMENAEEKIHLVDEKTNLNNVNKSNHNWITMALTAIAIPVILILNKGTSF